MARPFKIRSILSDVKRRKTKPNPNKHNATVVRHNIATNPTTWSACNLKKTTALYLNDASFRTEPHNEIFKLLGLAFRLVSN